MDLIQVHYSPLNLNTAYLSDTVPFHVFYSHQGIVFLSDCIFGAPSFQSTKVPAQPLKKESEEGSGEEDEDDEAEEKSENKKEQSGVRKRV